MRLPLVILIVVLFASGAAVKADDCSAIGTRKVLRFYRYQGVTSDVDKSAYLSFRQMVDTQLTATNQALGIPSKFGLSAKPSANASAPFIDGDLNPDKVSVLVGSDATILELSDGFQTVSQDGSHQIISNIYLITPTASSPIRPILETVDVVTWKYSDALKIHMGATYYALALEAKARNCDLLQAGMLNRSWEALHDVHHAGKQIDALKSEIRRALDSNPALADGNKP